MTNREYLEGLTEPQREAVTHTEGPLLVLAGPGSGKTRVITRRAAYLACEVTRPYHILAVTFTNKAAGEMAARMDRLGVSGVTCSTFHSLCARLLRIHHDRAGLRENFSIFDDDDQLKVMKEAVKRVDLSTDNFSPRAMLTVVSRAKNDMIFPDQFKAEARGWQNKKIGDVYAAYNALLAEQNAADFDDLLIKTALLLRDHPDVRDRLERRYQYVLVDEYQDTNHAQYLIAHGLTIERRNLCVTGDPDQSIYAWRGADINNILEFERDHPDAKVARLEQNYRSTPQILAAADAVIRHNKQRKHKKLWTENPSGPAVRVVECEDQYVEARFVAREIRGYVEAGGRFGDTAVFYRINALSRNLEGALRDAQIPYQVARGVAFFQRKEIKDILAYLKAAVNPPDAVALGRIINTPSRGIGKTTVDRIFAHAARTAQPPLEVIAEAEKISSVSRALKHLKSFVVLMHDLKAAVSHGTVQDAVEFVVRHSGLIAMW
ncbi:MAG TPA: UvrD-helicase domain-containing protein, partial [Phycisphaerae bacterium]|nr:UvrD-helicase domain-containing protein [Phycisphaerae bacterium]